MITASESSSRPAPDRLFASVIWTVMGAGLALAVTSHAIFDAATRDQGRAASQARVAAEASDAAQVSLARLVMLGADATPSAKDLTAARQDLAWLLARDGVRAASGPDANEIARVAEEARAVLTRPGFDEGAVSELRGLIASQLAPRLDLTRVRAANDSARAVTKARQILLGSTLAYLLVGAGLVTWIILPARRRVRDWVRRTLEADQENRFRLLHDPLTSLPNTTYLHAYLTQLAAGAARAQNQTAVLRVELDKFSLLRETLGQRTADEIIRITARRVQHALRGGDFAAYLGHGDFVVVAGELADANAAAVIAGRLQTTLGNPFSIRGGARRLGTSIGVTLLSDDEADADRVIANAEIALAEAQGAGPGNIRYFRESLRVEVERRQTLYTELLTGLGRGELIPFFQPQVDLRGGGFAGFEALVRWEHPRHGLLTPAAFLDHAEHADLTERIGETVLTQTLEAIRAWDAAGLHVPRVGVNFALAQLRDPRLIEKIKWEVERFDLAPSRLAIEVLETVLIKSDADLVVRNLRGLASAGFHIELDDFGTGHASISNLRRFMVNRIKIDRGFIFGIETSDEQQQLTASMIAMAHALGISTLAEGVETEDAEAVLRRLGCDLFQGFLLAKPMSRADTFHWLRSFRDRNYDAPGPGGVAAGDPNTP